MSKEEEQFSWFDLVRAFRYLIGTNIKRYLTFLIPLFLISFYTVVPPFLLGRIVDFFSAYRPGLSPNLFYVYALTLGVSYSLVSYIRLSLKKFLGNIRSDIVYDINVKGFDRLLSLSWKDSRKEVAGEKAQKLTNGTQAFVSIFEQIDNELFQAIAATIGIAIVFLYLKYYYLIFLILYLLGFFSIIRYYYSRIQQVKLEYNKASEKSGGSYVEGLNNILTIKTLGVKNSFNSRIAAKEEIKKQFEYLGRRYGIGQWIAFQVFNGVCIAVYLLLIGRDVTSGVVSLGSIVIFYSYFEKLAGNASNILAIYEQLISSKISIARMMPIFWSSRSVEGGQASFPANWQKLALNAASFDYNEDDDTIKPIGVHNLNFTLNRNEHVGIIGKTGSGKSTLAKILVGLFPLTTGHYTIDNQDFYSMSSDEVSNHISLVLQDSEIFNLTLKENITLMRHLDSQALDLALEISCLQEVIDKLPNGLDTMLGEKGYRLSGGERQRIGIARAIYRNPEIIIFDEATSSLDVKTEQKIQHNLNSKLDKKTTIWITHRLATLEGCDKIYKFAQGKLTLAANSK